ncbi:9969_t:CDS:2 [Cetraspora pellucida]|uniref:9969_t:CDS:1 n=1 Tax=Cetraspora pellucida TaxID=1433469 RepID=A0A9N9DVL5_9GLOM|nr:9969_t:CDS:2 [Cetraspora pellucida]
MERYISLISSAGAAVATGIYGIIGLWLWRPTFEDRPLLRTEAVIWELQRMLAWAVWCLTAAVMPNEKSSYILD